MSLKTFATVVLLAGASCACSSSPKPAAGPRVDVSIGQQLIELKEAYDSGALTEKEYKAQKKYLIQNVK